MHNYNFDPATMYQPAIPEVDFVTTPNGVVVVHRDGTVTSDVTEPWHDTVRGYNSYIINGSCYAAYKVAANALWPKFPKNLKVVDHIDRNPLNNHPSNLRWCNSRLNAINNSCLNTRFLKRKKRWESFLTNI